MLHENFEPRNDFVTKSWFFGLTKFTTVLCFFEIKVKLFEGHYSFIVDFYDSFDSGGDAITSPSLEKRENLPLNQLLPCTYYITQIDPPLHGDRTIKGAVPITFASKKFEKSKKIIFQKIKKINFEKKTKFFKSKKNEYCYNDHVRIGNSCVRRAHKIRPIRGLPWLLHAPNRHQYAIDQSAN